MSSPKTQPVRTRFAPSPTGYLHLGVLRSSLFNWLWAKHNQGTFILRIEDTDRQRLIEGAFEQILADHDVLGITPDEGPSQGGKYGPYIQSERKEQGIYARYSGELLQSGALYPCWCSPERLTKLREEAQAKGIAFKYDRHCLIPANQKSQSEPHVLRFRIPDQPEIIAWDDAVRGRLEFRATDLDDFVAIKADGFPTYQFANVIDDHLMEISHVLRADEWIPSTPKHLLLYAALGWDPPILAHLPAVQGPTGGKKLSKRDGARSVQDYIQDGYLPEALRSFLATLGWNDGTTQEIYSTPELIDKFTLDRIQKSPARFDLERLTWVNGKMIRALWESDPLDLLEHTAKFWPEQAATTTKDYRKAVLGLVYDRLRTLKDLPDLTDFFFVDLEVPSGLLSDALSTFTSPREATDTLGTVIARLYGLATFDEPSIEQTLTTLERELSATSGRESSRKQLFGLIRVLTSGKPSSPPLFPTLAVLGKATVLRRLHTAHDLLNR